MIHIEKRNINPQEKMFKSFVECVSRQYTIEVDLKAIMDSDFQKEEKGQCDDVLNIQLDAIEGVSETDYNGHFGGYVWINIEAKHDTDETWAKIETLITKAMVIPRIFEKHHEWNL